MIALLLELAAYALPVVCDPVIARRTLEEARIDEARAPVSHPELIPGLALAAAGSDPTLTAALAAVCAPGGALSLGAIQRFDSAAFAATALWLVRTEPDGCALAVRSVAVTVGTKPGEPPVYGVLTDPPDARTPVGDCAEAPAFRDEVVIDGEGGPVRVVLQRDWLGEAVSHAIVVVRVAGASGWREHVLFDPAPPRLVEEIEGTDGPLVELTDRFDPKWVVAHGDRSTVDGVCADHGGQTVWAPDDWAPHADRDALTLLAERGLWRMAGDDGWFLIVAQDDEEDAERLYQRAERLRARSGQDLLVVQSAWFPGLNPGYLIAILPPWATEAEARVAREQWRPRRQAYVKRAWTAPDACLP